MVLCANRLLGLLVLCDGLIGSIYGSLIDKLDLLGQPLLLQLELLNLLLCRGWVLQGLIALTCHIVM